MKTTFKLTLVAFILFNTSCTKESKYIQTTSKSQLQEEVKANTASHYIGEHFGGGIVFYIDSTGEHGLIADTADLGEFSWRPQNIITITGANKTGIYKGESNTKQIIKSQGSTTMNGNYAALACSRLQKNGYSDWYLPAKAELHQLYKQRKVVGGFKTGGYWSSSEVIGNAADYAAWYEYFPNDVQDANYKYNVIKVRAIRSF